MTHDVSQSTNTSNLTDEEAYEAYCREEEARYERECGVSITVGPAHDPYSTSCELDKGHEPPHSGPDPFGRDEPLRWEGGGSCAGDPLPFTIRPKEEDDA